MKNFVKTHVALLLSLSVAAVSAAAFAFPFGKSWMEPADGNDPSGSEGHFGRAGGGGLWGTGSKMDKGIKCSHCHIEPDNEIDATIDFSPQLSGGKYVPGQTYDITVELLNEVHLPDANTPETLNGFALTFENQNGQRAGVLRSDLNGVDSTSCPSSFPNPDPTNATSYVYGNCNAIVYVPLPDSTLWSMRWTAPAAGSGTVNMYYGVVDGDQVAENSKGDDTKEGIVTIMEGP